jgi:mitochondrial import receptor subunit TOM22
MVKVEIVDEKDVHTAGSSPYSSHASSRTGSSASLSSVGSDVPDDETLYDRLSALVDIVPPTTRHSISSKLSKTGSFLRTGSKLVGNVVWIVTTSMLLVGLPLALSLEDEAMRTAQEKEMLAQQQGAQQVSARLLSFLALLPASSPRALVSDDAGRLALPKPTKRPEPAEGSGATRFLNDLQSHATHTQHTCTLCSFPSM